METTSKSVFFSVTSITLCNRWKADGLVYAAGRHNFFVSNRGLSSKQVRVSMNKKSDDVSYINLLIHVMHVYMVR